jgi:hypothetical protein
MNRLAAEEDAMSARNAIWDVTAGLGGEPLLPVSAFRTLADGLDHPEGVACAPTARFTPAAKRANSTGSPETVR